MILRRGLSFAVHAAGGAAMAVALVIAGAMLARLAQRQADGPDEAPPPEG